jgi:hypothetical protein
MSPVEVGADDEGAICLQASTIEDDLFYTCTETEVLVYQLPEFTSAAYISLPIFNDIHHVRPSLSGNILVANAGLEMVVEISFDGEIINTWNVLGKEDPSADFQIGYDYRRVSTKPHRAHPNFVFYLGEELWATRFQQGDAISLEPPGRTFVVSNERVHDGIVHDGRIYFTVVDGKIIGVNTQTLEVDVSFDLNTFHDERCVLGWCRGILVDGNRIWVGFSRIRATRFRENVGWVARGFSRHRETRIACYDLVTRRCISEIDLEPAGLAAVYSILPAA